MSNKLTRRIAVIFLCAAMLMSAFGCASEPAFKSGEDSTDSEGVSTGTQDGEKTEPENTIPPETTAEPETTDEPDETTAADSESTDESSGTDETTSEQTDIIYNSGTYGCNESGQVINPLTGEKGGEEMLTKRPVAIMINNLKASLPQVGISQADVLYECMVEGGITRLMMVVMDYENLGVVGSIRSSREYYIDLAQNHDAIYIHAGGSNQAYVELKSRSINNIDGVNKPAPGMFYRDPERMKIMALEHTLVTTGEKIVGGIKYFKYRTEVKSDLKSMLHFVSYDSEPLTPTSGEAMHVIVPYNSLHFPQYIYNPATKTYARYQYKGDAHIDGSNGEQLSFTNVIVLACPHYNTNDSYNHIDVDPVGQGEGYYISNGAYQKIKWVKSTGDVPMVLYDENGEELVVNCGKTMINIVSPSVFENTSLNYKQ